MKKPTHIACKRWFQKSFGNTYFSSTVYFDDGTSEVVIKYGYGYGDHCLDESLKWLAANGYATLPAPYDNGNRSYNTTIFLREELKCSYDIADVQRKKEL